MSNLDSYLERLKKKHVGETKKAKLKRVAKSQTAQAAMQAEKDLRKASAAVKKRNTPENRARVKKYSTKFYHFLQKL